MTGQRTDQLLKLYMPDFCQAPYVSIRQDNERGHMFQVKYDHICAAAKKSLDPEKVESLPKRLQGKTKNSPYSVDATMEAKDVALEKALQWAWDKHEHLTGQKRPIETMLLGLGDGPSASTG